MPATVTAIIVNFNGKTLVDQCLESLVGQTRPPDEIVVIDNASTDGSPEEIRCHFPAVHLIALEQNVGFAQACNLGITHSSCELIAILNNDILLDRRWLQELLRYNAEPWDFWASRIVFASDPTRIDSAGDGMAVIGSAYKTGHGEAATEYAVEREVFGPCAAAALYRREMLTEVGGFDSDFFLVYEDADLNMRARLKGYRCLYVPKALVHHHVNQSIRTFSHVYVFYGHRNSELLFWKNMPLPLLIAYLPERIIFDLLSFIYFAAKGRAISFLQAKVAFARQFPRLLRKRRVVQREKTAGWRELRRLLDRNWFRYRRKAAINS